MDVREGGVVLSVDAEMTEGTEAGVFFNPDQELNRDLTVAALSALRERTDAATYLDATAATGVRGVRAAADGWDVTCADVDPAAVDRSRENLARNDLEGEAVHRDANVLMHQRRFDVVDVDPFGTPMPFADAAVRSARTLLAVTATDTAPLCGAHMASGRRSYDAVPQNTEYHAEVGLRVLVSALARVAARRDVGVEPVLSHASDHYARTYLRCRDGASVANETLDALGAVHHCRDCLYREAERGPIPNPPDACQNCGGGTVVTATPLWLDRLCDPDFVADARAAVPDAFGTAERARDLCGTLAAELATPTHYDHHRLCELWTRSAAPMDDVLADLRAAGHAASRTHYGGTTFKTDADVAAIRAATAD